MHLLGFASLFGLGQNIFCLFKWNCCSVKFLFFYFPRIMLISSWSLFCDMPDFIIILLTIMIILMMIIMVLVILTWRPSTTVERNVWKSVLSRAPSSSRFTFSGGSCGHNAEDFDKLEKVDEDDDYIGPMCYGGKSRESIWLIMVSSNPSLTTSSWGILLNLCESWAPLQSGLEPAQPLTLGTKTWLMWNKMWEYENVVPAVSVEGEEVGEDNAVAEQKIIQNHILSSKWFKLFKIIFCSGWFKLFKIIYWAASDLLVVHVSWSPENYSKSYWVANDLLVVHLSWRPENYSKSHRVANDLLVVHLSWRPGARTKASCSASSCRAWSKSKPQAKINNQTTLIGNWKGY